MEAPKVNKQATQMQTAKPLERSKGSKLCDGLVILIILIIGSLIEFAVIAINPNKQYIPGSDIDINYNFAYPDVEETVSDAGLIMIVALPWYILLIISSICLYYFDKEGFSINEWKTHFSLMNRMLFFCFGVTLLVTGIIKLFIGAPRPYFLSGYNEDEDDNQIRLSFPSGHASLSTSSAFLLTMLIYNSWQYTQKMYYNQTYIIGMKTYNPHAYYLCCFWWLTRQIQLVAISFVFIPMYIALWCSLTRIRDYKHFAADVVAGMILGVSIAYVTHLIFYKEMYMAFDYRLNAQIQQSNALNATNNTDEDNGKEDNENANAVPLTEIIVGD